MNEAELKVEVNIRLSRNYIKSQEIMKSIEPDNDKDITIENNQDSYSINIKNVKIGSISSLCLDLLESIGLSKKMWEERI